MHFWRRLLYHAGHSELLSIASAHDMQNADFTKIVVRINTRWASNPETFHKTLSERNNVWILQRLCILNKIIFRHADHSSAFRMLQVSYIGVVSISWLVDVLDHDIS
jgi:hypothetical protein